MHCPNVAPGTFVARSYKTLGVALLFAMLLGGFAVPPPAAATLAECDSGAIPHGEETCEGSDRYRCNGAGMAPTFLSDCAYGCSEQNGYAYCDCANATAGSQYCSGANRYACNLSTSLYGSTSFLNFCQYGCYLESEVAYCRCLNGETGGEESCSGSTPQACNYSTNRYGSFTNFPACDHGCSEVDGTAACDCAEGMAGEDVCSDPDLFSCPVSKDTDPMPTFTETCTYGCEAGACSTCGDGNVDAGEDCDGGACCETDCSFSVLDTSCGEAGVCSQGSCDGAGTCVVTSEPVDAATCLSGAKFSFQVSDNDDDGKDKLQVKWAKGEAFDAASLGMPQSTTAYDLCIYDTTGDVSSLAGHLHIEPNAAWTDKAAKGFTYKDKAGTEDGIVKGKLGAGADGKTSVQLLGKGANVSMPDAAGPDSFFHIDSTLTLQLFADDPAGTCWSGELTMDDVKKNTESQFKAKK